MARFQHQTPSSLSTEELVALRTRLRAAIKYQEALAFLTVEEEADLKQARAYLRELMREAGKRFIQERLF